MIEIRQILCPIDFSDDSRRALEHAVAIAHSYGSAVTVMHVVRPVRISASGPEGTVSESIVASPVEREQLREEVRSFAASVIAPGFTVESVVREGDPSGEVVEQAGRLPADLVVIGAHGRSGFDRLALGSTAERIVRMAPCPVMAVPGPAADAISSGPAVLERILCPVDFSDSSLQALNYAVAMARQIDAQLTVLHVVAHESERSGDATSIADAGLTLDSFVKQREDALRRRLEATAGSLSGSCRIESQLTRGKPWREVLRLAAERRSDLIVMGVQGSGAAEPWFFGSTTQHVLRQAPCPVLTVRHPRPVPTPSAERQTEGVRQ